jgi:hypothetical protein
VEARVRRLVMANWRFLFLIAAIGLLFSGAVVAEQTCVAVDQSSEEVLPGVFLKWDSSFLCANAPDADTYKIEVRVRSELASGEGVTLEQLVLMHKTPRPRGRTPTGMKTGDTLPVTVAPGGDESLVLTGTYMLVQTDEGKKANHHYQAAGVGDSSGLPFSLGINVHFRAPGVAPE